MNERTRTIIGILVIAGIIGASFIYANNRKQAEIQKDQEQRQAEEQKAEEVTQEENKPAENKPAETQQPVGGGTTPNQPAAGGGTLPQTGSEDVLVFAGVFFAGSYLIYRREKVLATASE